MAKYQIVGVLLQPKGNYDEVTSPKGVKDFYALDLAFLGQDMETAISILQDYEIEKGAIEEHDCVADFIVDADADGYYLLKKLRVVNTCFGQQIIEGCIATTTYDDSSFFTLPSEDMTDEEIIKYFEEIHELYQ